MLQRRMSQAARIVIGVLMVCAATGRPAFGQNLEVDGNRIYLHGSWRITYEDGDSDDYWMFIKHSTGQERRIWLTEEEFETTPHVFHDSDPSGWFIEMVEETEDCGAPSSNCPPVWIRSEPAGTNAFRVFVDQRPVIDDLVLKFERIAPPAPTNQVELARRTIMAAVARAQKSLQGQDVSVEDFNSVVFNDIVTQRQNDSTNTVLRDAEYAWIGFRAGSERDLPMFAVVGVLPIYNAVKAIAVATGTQAELQRALEIIGQANGNPNSPPGGYLWTLRGLYWGLAGDLSGLAPEDASVPLGDPEFPASHDLMFPVNPAGPGIGTPKVLDPPFDTTIDWELSESSLTAYRAVVIPVGTLPPGAQLTLLHGTAEIPLLEGVPFDFGGTSIVRSFAIRASAPAPVTSRYVLGVRFTEPTRLAWIRQNVRPVPAVFTDASLVAGFTVIRSIHILELRARIDALRTRHQLASFTWTDATLAGLWISAVHITELRSALAAVYAAIGTLGPVYTDSTLMAGSTPVRPAHIGELRTAVIAIE